VAPEASHSTDRLAGRVALVTGASSGIGRAIALGLARHGAHLCVVGRNSIGLAETAAAARTCSEVKEFQLDLTVEEQLRPLVQFIEKTCCRLDILIHAAAVIRNARMECARIDDLDLQYATNVRAPYMLTQRLLPLLTTSQGHIVFINSTVGLSAQGDAVGQYSATKHALKAVADNLREEVNPTGIRVLTVYPGRTATPMQEAIHKQEGRAYLPEALLQPEDVASVVLQALMLPSTAEVTDISIRPMRKP